ncbi:glycerophosphoryl diester phosphodiesterase [Bogoriella caseilytica]|uniref:Glycerophosphoryl diester phosphodiesterase n=2 Tax=Bogoriella caseilytica TaxID=56055 RepID=A0A3N2BEK4_9MICO|nr:glycerophosphoryl diester phosphodiesterase [Bogoriella caseilytica]
MARRRSRPITHWIGRTVPEMSSTYAGPIRGAEQRHQPLVIAHRGASSLAPENTIPAMVAAAMDGADMIEIDVQPTADGAAVVIHDDSLERTTDGAGPISALDADEVRHLDAGSWFDPAYRGAALPLLPEVLALLTRHRGSDLLMEVKGTWSPELLAPVIALIDEAGLANRVMVQSFSVETVANLREVAPHLPRGLIVGHMWDATEELLDLCEELEVSACNPHGLMLLERPGLVRDCHARGLQVMTWTLNEAPHWAAATAAGVDGIITDRPGRLLGWLEARSLFPASSAMALPAGPGAAGSPVPGGPLAATSGPLAPQQPAGAALPA